MNKSLLTWKPSEMFDDSLFSQLLNWDNGMTGSVRMLQSDVYENDTSWFFKMSAPGVNQEDIRIVVENNVLTVRGETKDDIVDNTTRIYRRELRYGSFSRSFNLPDNTIPEQAHAKVEGGIILVEVPKRATQEEKPKALEIPINIKSLE